LGDHVGDDPKCVLANRELLNQYLPNEPLWLTQVHGTKVSTPSFQLNEADAIVTNQPNEVLAIMTADCLPILFTNDVGNVIGAAHAGWRGLCHGVIENTVKKCRYWLGQILLKICWLGWDLLLDLRLLKVGSDVLDAFQYAGVPFPADSFMEIPNKPGKYLANLYALARSRLKSIGLQRIYGGDYCTVNQAEKFFSYRRDGVTGRFASLIWINLSH
jgi:YfiH family protein